MTSHLHLPLLVWIGILILISNCTSKHVQLQSLSNVEVPPGTIKAGPNFYIDRTEVTNLGYREFVWWTASVYGTNSSEYQTIYPDSTTWNKPELKKTPFLFYFQNKAYKNCPVACVNHDQATKFTQWRSERVMEYLLRKKGFIPHHNSSRIHPDSTFTIGNYFTGKYMGLTPSPEVQYYASYELLDCQGQTDTGFRNTCTWKKK